MVSLGDMIPFSGEADSGKESAYWVEDKQQLVRLRETVKTQLLLTQTRILKGKIKEMIYNMFHFSFLSVSIH